MPRSVKSILRDNVAGLLARILRRFAHEPRYFDLWQKHGFHVLPLHFYSPVPDIRDLPHHLFESASALAGLDLNEAGQLELLSTIRRSFFNEYGEFVSRGPESGPERFRFGFGSIEAVDAEVLYSLIRLFQPARIIEIGAGYSTLIITEAVSANSVNGPRCRVTSIDPYPPEELFAKTLWPVEILRERVQNVAQSVFSELKSGDVLFIDSSHVCRIGSDVHFEFLEVLPRLAPGVVIHIHDIFLPLDYPKEWVVSRHRFWNEQYLLQAFLCGNRDFEVIWGGAWLHHYHPDRLVAGFPSYDPKKNIPASFWIRKLR